MYYQFVCMYLLNVHVYYIILLFLPKVEYDKSVQYTTECR